MNYVMLIFAAFLLACDFSINKLYQRRAGTGILAGLGFNALIGIFSAGIFFAASGFKIGFSFYSLIVAAIFTLFVMTYNIIGFRIMKYGSMAIYTLFLMTGGMLIPYIWGIAFLSEGFATIRLIGIILMIFAVALSNVGKEKINVWQIIMCISVFFLNGFTSVTSKLHQIEAAYETVDAIDFVVLTGLCKFIVSGIAYLVVRASGNNEKSRGQIGGRECFLIAASALISGVSFFLQLLGAVNLPATVLYPILTGGTMILSALAGCILFKDKLTRNNVIGLVLCFIGTLLFL